VKIFWAFARQSFHSTAIHHFDFWVRVASFPVWMYSIRWVWMTLYTQRPGAFGVTLEQMVTYGVLGIAVQSIYFTGPQYYMARQVRTGAIDADLMKPLDFHLHMLARSAGNMLFHLIALVFPAMLMGFFLFNLQPPANVVTSFLFTVALLLGFLVNFHLEFLLGSLALVTLEIHSIDWAFNALSRFFAGQWVPLWLFPGIVGGLAQALPFKCIFDIPLSIYTGKITGSAVVQVIGFQLIWLVVLLAASRWAWRRIHTRLVVQGG